MSEPSNRAPAPLERPKLARFLWERDICFRSAAEALGRSREWVRRVCLPFDDPRRLVPVEVDIERIVAWTRGEVSAGDFYRPHLRGAGVTQASEVAR